MSFCIAEKERVIDSLLLNINYACTIDNDSMNPFIFDIVVRIVYT